MGSVTYRNGQCYHLAEALTAVSKIVFLSYLDGIQYAVHYSFSAAHFSMFVEAAPNCQFCVYISVN